MKSAESTNDQNTITEDDAQHLIRLEQQRADACLGYDLAILEPSFAGGFHLHQPSGNHHGEDICNGVARQG